MKKGIAFILFITLLSLLVPLASAAPDMSVSATVPPRTSDFQLAFASTDGQTTAPQGTIFSYQITYGAKQSAGLTTTETIVADWSADTAPDSSEVLDYVLGSANAAYGGTLPIVDLQHKTITWTIPALPNGTTDQTLNFQLRTNSNYIGSNPVNFTIRTRMSNQYVTLPDQTISQTYQFDQSLVTPTPRPTNTPTPTPRATPTPTLGPNTQQNTPLRSLALIQKVQVKPTATPTPTPTPLVTATQPKLTSVSLIQVSQSSTTLTVTTNQPTKTKASYGTSPTNLSKTTTATSYSTTPSITLTNLVAQTTYYAQLTNTNQEGQTNTSEIFTFKTAKSSNQTNAENNIVTLSSDGNVLISDLQKKLTNTPQPVILTVQSNYQIAYKLSQNMPLKSVDLIVRNNVLGASTMTTSQTPNSYIIPMKEQSPGLYVATFKALIPGYYEMSVGITDTNGNIIEKQFAELRIIPHLSVLTKDTNLPVSNARVALSYYDTDSKHYKLITPALFGNIVNPLYTNAFGQVDTNLPAGNYQAQVSAPFYNTTTVNFTIGVANGQQFPTIYLTKNLYNILPLINNATDIALLILHALQGFAVSVKLFELIATVVIISFVIITFLLFSLRSHLHIKHMPLFFLFHIQKILKKDTRNFLFGKVTSEENEPLSQVQVQIEDAATKKIITHAMTNKNGKFYFANTLTEEMNLLFSKDAYALQIVSLQKNQDLPDDGLTIVLTKTAAPTQKAGSIFLEGIKDFCGMLFETGLVVSIFLEILFFCLYGFLTTLPFLILSCLNIALWLFFLHEHKQ